MTRVVISQPMYFPWVGFIAQMALADVFIWLDDAQFSKGSFTNRIQVKLPDGRKWMSVPLEGKGAFQTIRDLHSARKDWIPCAGGPIPQWPCNCSTKGLAAAPTGCATS